MTWARISDGPDCDTWQRGEGKGWLDITQPDSPPMHFCGWDCALKHGAQYAWSTVIDL